MYCDMILRPFEGVRENGIFGERVHLSDYSATWLAFHSRALAKIMRQLSEVALDCGNTHPTARSARLGSIHGTEGTSPLDKFEPRSRGRYYFLT
jgi:hypothetical protein